MNQLPEPMAVPWLKQVAPEAQRLLETLMPTAT
jgi:hypothetical protein